MSARIRPWGAKFDAELERRFSKSPRESKLPKVLKDEQRKCLQLYGRGRQRISSNPTHPWANWACFPADEETAPHMLALGLLAMLEHGESVRYLGVKFRVQRSPRGGVVLNPDSGEPLVLFPCSE